MSAESSADGNDIETIVHNEHILSEHILTDENGSDRKQIVSLNEATSIQIKQTISNKQVEEKEESCCGVMGFFENVRTLFDPDENDDDCKYLLIIVITWIANTNNVNILLLNLIISYYSFLFRYENTNRRRIHHRWKKYLVHLSGKL